MLFLLDQTLVEKEWLDFGHKFHDRSAHGALNPDDERSPIFVLWLDCVWQLVRYVGRQSLELLRVIVALRGN